MDPHAERHPHEPLTEHPEGANSQPVSGRLFDDDSIQMTEGALQVMRRGVARSPAMKQGLMATVGLGLSVAGAKLVAPVLLQVSLDRGVLSEAGVRPAVVVTASLAGAAVIALASVMSFVMQTMLIRRAEIGIADMRLRAFDHVHRLSIADHNETRRGILVARVTSDANALGAFVEWGLVSWIVQPIVIVGTFAVLFAYSWQLGLVAVAAYAPVVPLMRLVQQGMFAAHDDLRTETGSMLATYGESISGAGAIRAYGVEEKAREQLERASDSTYRAEIRANRYMATVFIIGDVFGAIALASVLAAGVWLNESWGITAGELTACLFLTTLIHHPVAELGETLDTSQAAAAGMSKMLTLMDRDLDIPEPVDGEAIPSGPIEVEAGEVSFAYRRSAPVLHSVTTRIPPGANVAIVGETGSGKTTFAKLLCRLADPSSGEIRLNGVALPAVAPESRLASVRMVPQDGFLFDVSIRENISYGRPGATDADIAAALAAIDLDGWADKFPRGIDTVVGERGGNLSVGERQLVALARAALADPGLLILDEATSAVDPETDQALTTALRRLASERTMVSIAHRLATAEAADVVLVFDRGRLAETGTHSDLVARGGTYSRLHAAWVGSTHT